MPVHRTAQVAALLTTGLVVVAGEVTTTTYAPIAQLVREKILEIGYDSSVKGFDGESCGISVSIGKQSPDIAQGVDDAIEEALRQRVAVNVVFEPAAKKAIHGMAALLRFR